MAQGKLVLVVGPSGSGKGTLVEYIQANYPDIVYPVACTTRAMRPGDVEGKQFYFIDESEFKKRIAADYFLEFAQYGGHYYGSPKNSVLPYLAEGRMIVDELEAQGARQVLEKIPAEQRALVFIDGGSWDDLEKRIRARAPITEEELAKRKSRYDDEMTLKSEADFVIENPQGGLEKAKQDIDDVIASLRKSIGLS